LLLVRRRSSLSKVGFPTDRRRRAAAAAAAALAEKGEEVGDGMLLLGYVGRIELTFCRLWRGGD
jgi:hypothetical protein